MNWKEFRPTIFFLARFLGLYLIGNLSYGWYVSSFHPSADPVTQSVTRQTAMILNAFDWNCEAVNNATKSTVEIVYATRNVLSVYEGCNGINVMIIFISFIFAFGPFRKAMIWFIPVGLLIIHLGNLVRICLLFFVVLKLPGMLYFSHKYLFTASIYAIVFLLWMIWVKVFSLSGKHENAPS